MVVGVLYGKWKLYNIAVIILDIILPPVRIMPRIMIVILTSHRHKLIEVA
jgi:hypothetical protein